MLCGVHLRVHLEMIKLFSAATVRNLVDDSKLWKNIQKVLLQSCWIWCLQPSDQASWPCMFSAEMMKTCPIVVCTACKNALFKKKTIDTCNFFTWTFALFGFCQWRALCRCQNTAAGHSMTQYRCVWDGLETLATTLWQSWEEIYWIVFLSMFEVEATRLCDTNKNIKNCGKIARHSADSHKCFLLVNFSPVRYNL